MPLLVNWIRHIKQDNLPPVQITPNLANHHPPTREQYLQWNDAQSILFILLKRQWSTQKQKLEHTYIQNTQVKERHLHDVNYPSPKHITTAVSFGFGCRSASCISSYGDKLNNTREERGRHECWTKLSFKVIQFIDPMLSCLKNKIKNRIGGRLEQPGPKQHNSGRERLADLHFKTQFKKEINNLLTLSIFSPDLLKPFMMAVSFGRTQAN